LVDEICHRHSAKVAVRPYPLTKAVPFCRLTHRRLPNVLGGMWSIAAVIDEEVVGVAIVGHPQARMSDDGVSLEVTRVAVREGSTNACSALYAACSRAARAMGAADLWTFVHGDETGHSLRAAGWVKIGICGGGEWSRDGRQRELAIDPNPKVKWSAPWGRIAKRPKE
jgi:hypothetical protein